MIRTLELLALGALLVAPFVFVVGLKIGRASAVLSHASDEYVRDSDLTGASRGYR